MIIDPSIIIRILALAVLLAGVAGGLSVSLLNEITIKDKREKEKRQRIKQINENKYTPIDKLV